MRSARFVAVMAGVGVLALCGAVWADDFSSQMSGNWNCKAQKHYGDNTDKDVWGQGIGATGKTNPVPTPVEGGVNFPWAGDTGVVNAGHTVKFHTESHGGWYGTGEDPPATLTVVLNGGTLGFTGESKYDDVSSPIRVQAPSAIAPQSVDDDGYDQRGGISDYDGANTGKLTVVGSGKDMSLSGDQSGFSGGWDIGSNHLWFGAWEGNPGAGDGCLGTGTVEVNGGSLRFHYNAGTLNNAIILGANGCEVEDGRGDLGKGTVTLAGPITGPGTLTVDADYADRIKLTNGTSSYDGLLMKGGSSMVVQAPGALGLLTTVQSGVLKLDNHGASWDACDKDLVITGGKVQYNTGVTDLTVHGLTLGTDTFPDGTYDIHTIYTSNEGNPVDFNNYFIGASTVVVKSGQLIPEPAGLGLIGLAGLALLKRRRRP